jgi:hypothetical protein
MKTNRANPEGMMQPENRGALLAFDGKGSYAMLSAKFAKSKKFLFFHI